VVHPVAWLIGRLRGRPVVQWYADVFLGKWRTDFGVAGWLGEVVERVSLFLPADHYIPISQSVAKKLERRGIPPALMTVIPCGVEEELAASVRAEGVAKTTTIVVVSRLLRYKGVHLVLDAVAMLAAMGQEASVAIIGQGPELSQLEAQAVRLGIQDRVRFEGHVTRHRDVLRMMASGRLFVSASSIEGFGIVLAEAMSLGLPCIASDIDAFREVTGNGLVGALFRNGDARDLADRLMPFLNDEAVYRASSLAALRWSQQYNWEDIASRSEDVYKRVVRDHKLQRGARTRRHRRVISLAVAGSLTALIARRLSRVVPTERTQ